ncbi:MAG: hypothetical protein R2932_06020 [Caldilineaceae bacterium]
MSSAPHPKRSPLARRHGSVCSMRWLLNSAIVTGFGTLTILLLASLSAYAFARLEFPGRNFLFSMLIASLLIPGTVTLIPAFLLLRDIGTIPGLAPIWGWGPIADLAAGLCARMGNFFPAPTILFHST